MGMCGIVFFDGATNVKISGSILVARYPRISVGNVVEYVVALFFLGVFSKIIAYKLLMKFAKRLHNIFVSIRHATT